MLHYDLEGKMVMAEGNGCMKDFFIRCLKVFL